MLVDDLIQLLVKVNDKIEDNSDVGWAMHYNPTDLKGEILESCRLIKSGDYKCVYRLSLLFAPTGRLQEHSIANGWATEFLRFSEEFDSLYLQFQKQHFI